MFNRRMKILLIVFAAFGGILIARLISVQVWQHNQYSNMANSAPMTPLKPIPPNRGRILARGPGGDGTVELVANEPCFELAVYYPVMKPDKWWMAKQFSQYRRQFRKEKNDPQFKISKDKLKGILKNDIENFWRELSRITNTPLSELWKIRDNTVRVIEPRVANVHAKLHEVDYPILEQRMYYPLIADLDEEEALELRSKLSELNWAKIRPSSRRLYRRGDTLCHLLGRTIKTAGSLSKTFTILDREYLPGEIEGLNGLESICDDMLKGKRGWIELNKNQQIIETPEDGNDIVLTIDVALQEYVQHRLAQQIRELPYATGGAVVVIDVENWKLLALASAPTYEPGRFLKDYKELSSDYKYLPLFNRALRGRYAPGSIVKPIVGAWAVSENIVSPFKTFFCNGYLSEHLKKFRCWLPSGHGHQDMIHSIKNSCDVYYYHIGELMTAEGMSDFYNKIGFGSDVPIGISNSAGRVPNQRWFAKHHKRSMSVGDARNLAIGQGDLEITPLQAAMMTAAVATGRYQPPRLIEGELLPKGNPIGISEYALNLARNGMIKVLNDRDGTGRKYAWSEDMSVMVAGKTGSAQAPSRSVEWEVSYEDPISHTLVKQRVDNLRKFIDNAPVPRKDLNWRTTKSFPSLSEEDQYNQTSRRKNSLAHGWFTGYAPAKNPKIVIAVLIEYGMAGGSGAGPVFKDVMLMCQDLGYVGDKRKITLNNWLLNDDHVGQ